MSRNNQPNGKAAGRRPQVVRLTSSCLIALLALCLSAVAVAVFLAGHSMFDWDVSLCSVGEAPLHQCPERDMNPSLLQIQVIGGGEHSTYDVVVDPEKNQWTGELVNALRQIQQALHNDDGSVSNVVVDREENPWIDELLDVLRGAVETQVTEKTVREYIEKQLRCADEGKLPAECSVTVAGGQEVARILTDINSNLTGINNLLGSERKWEDYPSICDSGKTEWYSGHIITFGHNSDVLDEDDIKTIKDIAQLIKDKKDNSLLVVVEGRADPSGRYLYNKDLAERRADVVQKQLEDVSVEATVIVPQGELVLSEKWLHKKNDERRSVRVGTCKKTWNSADST